MDPVVAVLGSVATLAGVPLAITGVAQVLRTAGRAVTSCDARRIRGWAWLASMAVIVPAVRSMPAAHALPPAMEWSATDVTSTSSQTVRTPAGYVVEPGDSLWRIASRHLVTSGQPHASADVSRFWRAIYDINRDVIGCDPNLIFPGQRLSIPEM